MNTLPRRPNLTQAQAILTNCAHPRKYADKPYCVGCKDRYVAAAASAVQAMVKR